MCVCVCSLCKRTKDWKKRHTLTTTRVECRVIYFDCCKTVLCTYNPFFSTYFSLFVYVFYVSYFFLLFFIFSPALLLLLFVYVFQFFLSFSSLYNNIYIIHTVRLDSLLLNLIFCLVSQQNTKVLFDAILLVVFLLIWQYQKQWRVSLMNWLKISVNIVD